MNKQQLITGVAAGIGLGIGFAAGYLVSKKRSEKRLEVEIDSVKQAFDPSRKEGIFATPEGAVEALIPDVNPLQKGRDRVEELIRQNGYAVDPEQDAEWARQAKALADEERVEDSYSPDAETIVKSIWDNTAAQVNPDAMEHGDVMPERNLDKPYIITEMQFMTDGIHEDDKVNLLYFEADGQLVDDRESLIPNIEEIVGEQNLTHFGLGSNDGNAVYIRNEKLDCDFEIIRDKRSFSEVVLGVKPARQNSSLRKMRDDDQ